jgi:hypothetical protein
MQDVIAWLNNEKKPYRVGVMLYTKYGSNLLLKKSFTTEPESIYKKQRLLKELSALVPAVVLPTEKQNEPKQVAPNIKVKPGEPVKPEPSLPAGRDVLPAASATIHKTWARVECRDDYELKLWEKAALLLKEIASLHAQLSACFSDYERRTVAFNLLRKDDELDKIYEQRDYYRVTHKEVDPSPVQLITDPFLMAKRISALSRYIRREKTNITTKGDTQERRDRLKGFVEEYNAYAEKVNKPFLSC